MTILGIILVVLGARAAWDEDNQVYQTVSGALVMIIGFILLMLGETSWLDRFFLR